MGTPTWNIIRHGNPFKTTTQSSIGFGILSKYSTKTFTSHQRNPTTILFIFPWQKKDLDSLNMRYSASNQESFKAINDEYQLLTESYHTVPYLWFMAWNAEMLHHCLTVNVRLLAWQKHLPVTRRYCQTGATSKRRTQVWTCPLVQRDVYPKITHRFLFGHNLYLRTVEKQQEQILLVCFLQQGTVFQLQPWKHQ